jgi:hypothetical protein
VSTFGTARQDPATAAGRSQPVETRASARPHAYRQLAILGVAVLVAALTVGWLLVVDRGGDTQARIGSTPPRLVSRGDLERFANSVNEPIYWAGPHAGFSYELSATANGRIFVRYLPDGVAAGDSRASFLAVGTYRDSHAFANLKRAARRDDTLGMPLGHDGLAISSQNAPNSVYLAYPGSNYQVEVFDPSGRNARRLALSGAITRVR